MTVPTDPPTSRDGLKAMLAQTLAAPSSRFGYTVTAVSCGEAVEITLEKGSSTLVLWLKPASDEAAHYKKTSRFKVGHAGDPPDALGLALLDAACAQIGVWERSLPEDACAHLFDPRPEPGSEAKRASPATILPGLDLPLEWLAVRSGLKPTCRNVVRSADADGLVEEARACGLHARITPADTFIAGFCSRTVTEGTTTLIHVARTEEAASAVAAAERAMVEAYGRGEWVTPELTRVLGAALGYPPCCIETFIAIQNRSAAEIRFDAVLRTPARASALLNNIVEGRALVSHYVCRYDCAASIQYAGALLQELRRAAPAAADELTRALAGLVIFVRDGGALRLIPAATAMAETYRFTDVDAAGDGARFESWRAALRGADALQTQGDQVRILRGAEETCRLPAPPDEVQIRLFA